MHTGFHLINDIQRVLISQEKRRLKIKIAEKLYGGVNLKKKEILEENVVTHQMF